MWLRLTSRPVEHHRRVDQDEDQEPDEHEEMQRTRGLDAERLADTLEPRRQRGGHAEASEEGERGGDEDGDEIGDQLQAVVGRPAVADRPFQGEVLDQHRQRVREDSPTRGHKLPPVTAREQQDVKDRAVQQPHRVDA